MSTTLPKRPVRMLAAVTALMLSVGVFAVAADTSAAAGSADTTPPVLLSFDFSPKTVDVTSASATVHVTTHITDDQTGAHSPTVRFRDRSGRTTPLLAAMTLTSGSANDGIWSADLLVPAGTRADAWQPDFEGALIDRVYNVGSTALLSTVPDLTVVNTWAPPLPAMRQLTVTPSSLDVTTSGQSAQVALSLANDTYIEWLDVTFASETSTQTAVAAVLRPTIRQDDGIWIYGSTVYIPEHAAPGIWRSSSFALKDYYGRTTVVPEGAATFTVVSPDPDLSAPTLVSLSAGSSTADVSKGRATATLTARITDSGTGAAPSIVTLECADGSQSVSSSHLTRVSGTALDGVYRATVTLPHHARSGGWHLKSMPLPDAAGNTVEAAQPDDAALLTVIDVPAAPASITATADAGSATVTWSAAADNGSPVTAYHVFVQTLDGQLVNDALRTTLGPTSVRFDGLRGGVAYKFGVFATSVLGSGLMSQWSAPVTPAPGVPTAPRLTAAGPGDGQVSLTWDPPSSDGGSPITQYTVTATPGGQKVTTTGATKATMTGLTNGMGYGFTVTATNAVGDSAPSAQWSVTLLRKFVLSPMDFTGDGKADVLRVDGKGDVSLYRGTGTGLLAPTKVRSDWSGYLSVFSPGDFDGDRKSDVMAVDKDGRLYLYRGNGTGGFADWGLLVGRGWGSMTTMFAPGDFSGDGKPDILGVQPGGDLYLYRGNGTGGWAGAGQKIGNGWNQLTVMFSPRDFTGDGRPDALGVFPNGDLYLYKGNGAGGWLGSRVRIGNGWNGLTAMFSPGDFNGDRKNDAMGLFPNGDLYLYKGNGAGGWLGSRIKIASGL